MESKFFASREIEISDEDGNVEVVEAVVEVESSEIAERATELATNPYVSLNDAVAQARRETK